MAGPAPKCDPGPDTREAGESRSALHAEIQPESKTPECLAEFLGRFGEGGLRGCRGRRSRNRRHPEASSLRTAGSSVTRPVRLTRPRRHGREPERDRRADASKGSNQPEADAMTCHVKENLWATQRAARKRAGKEADTSNCAMGNEPARGRKVFAHNHVIMARASGAFNRSATQSSVRASGRVREASSR